MRVSLLSSWSKGRSFLRVSLGDARAIIAAVLGLLLVTFAVFQQTSPDAAVFRLLRHLPPEVRVVLIEPAAAQPSRQASSASSSKDFVTALLKLPPARVPADIPVLATLVMEDAAGSEKSLVLVEQSVVQRFGLRGVAVGSLVALGDGNEFFAARLRKKQRPVSPPLLRELRVAPGLRMLVQPTWIMRRFPALPQPTGSAWMALWVQGDSRRLRTEGILPVEEKVSRVNGQRLLATRPEGTLLVLDGIPVSAVLPLELPPLLEALRAETGVGSEVRALAEVLQNAPAFFSMQTRPEGVPVITSGIKLTKENRQRAETGVQELLSRRLAIAQAAVETIQSDGRTIRHARSSGSSGLEETREGPWRILRAPKAAGTVDLIAGFRDDMVVFGTSPESVRGTSEMLRPVGARDSTIQFFLDGALLRRVPAVAFALRGLPSELRPWAELLERLVIEISPGIQHIRLVAEIEWSSQPPGVP